MITDQPGLFIPLKIHADILDPIAAVYILSFVIDKSAL